MLYKCQSHSVNKTCRHLTTSSQYPERNFSYLFLYAIQQQTILFSIPPQRYVLKIPMGRDSSVFIATRYGLDGPTIESRWRRDFPHPFKPSLGSTQPSAQWVPGHSRGLSGRGGLNYPPLSSAEVKEEYSYTSNYPSGPSWLVVG